MVDGSGARGCRICNWGWFRIVRKRGGHAPQSAAVRSAIRYNLLELVRVNGTTYFAVPLFADLTAVYTLYALFQPIVVLRRSRPWKERDAGLEADTRHCAVRPGTFRSGTRKDNSALL